MKNTFGNILVCGIVGLLVGTFSASAELGDRSWTDISVTNTGASVRTIAINGEIEGVQVTVPSGQTGTVSVVDSVQTIFSKTAINATTFFGVRGFVTDNAGNALSTNTFVRKFPSTGIATVTVTGVSSGTNTYGVKVIYSR